MKYSENHLDEAVKIGIFSADQAVLFRSYILSSNTLTTKSQKALQHSGGLLVVFASLWLITSAWNRFGPIGILAISALYFIAFLAGGTLANTKNKMNNAGGMLVSIAIMVVPFLTYSLLQVFDFWPLAWEYADYYGWVTGKWLLVEASVLLVALPLLIKSKFPFIIFLIAFSTWFLSMDSIAIVLRTMAITWNQRAIISIVFGSITVSAGYAVDLKSQKEFSFWLYLLGLVTLSLGLSVFSNANIFRFILLGLVNILLIAIALFLSRNVFLVFGIIGIAQFLCRLSWVYFRGSVLLPFALAIMGAFLIYAGLFVKKNINRIDTMIKMRLPLFLFNLRPKR